MLQRALNCIRWLIIGRSSGAIKSIETNARGAYPARFCLQRQTAREKSNHGRRGIVLLLGSHIRPKHIHLSVSVHAGRKRKKAAPFSQASLGEGDELVEDDIQVRVDHTKLIAPVLSSFK